MDASYISTEVKATKKSRRRIEDEPGSVMVPKALLRAAHDVPGGYTLGILLVLLAHRHDRDGEMAGLSWPCAAEIARQCGAHVGTVKRVLSRLVAKGYLRCEGYADRRGEDWRLSDKPGQHRPKAYRVVVPRGSAGAQPEVAPAHAQGCAGATETSTREQDQYNNSKQKGDAAAAEWAEPEAGAVEGPRVASAMASLFRLTEAHRQRIERAWVAREPVQMALSATAEASPPADDAALAAAILLCQGVVWPTARDAGQRYATHIGNILDAIRRANDREREGTLTNRAGLLVRILADGPSERFGQLLPDRLDELFGIGSPPPPSVEELREAGL
jgi:DNA-binding MarR family transcriptional regulator